jgi:uncharacterized membrane protein YhaH (DUF805 family)
LQSAKANDGAALAALFAFVFLTPVVVFLALVIFLLSLAWLGYAIAVIVPLARPSAPANQFGEPAEPQSASATPSA